MELTVIYILNGGERKHKGIKEVFSRLTGIRAKKFSALNSKCFLRLIITDLAMGVFLSEPKVNKKIKEGSGVGLTYCKADMQGKDKLTQDGAITCRTQLSMKSILNRGSRSLEFLMGTEVMRSANT